MGSGFHAHEGPPRLVFGPFVIDVDRAKVSRDGVAIGLRPKTFALLVHLVDRAGTVVGKQELMDAVWGGLVVTDDSLTQAVSELRGALEDREQKLIKTIPKRGYLLEAAMRPAQDPPIDTGTAEPPAAAPRSRQRRWVAALAVALLAGAGVFGFARFGAGAARQSARPSSTAARWR